MEIKKGDTVEILPYDKVQDHRGIGRDYWNDIFRTNPHLIAKSNGVGIYLVDSLFLESYSTCIWQKHMMKKVCLNLPDYLFEI